MNAQLVNIDRIISLDSPLYVFFATIIAKNNFAHPAHAPRGTMGHLPFDKSDLMQVTSHIVNTISSD